MEQNYKDAIKWLDLAAEKGDAEAQFKLGKILSETGAKFLSSSIKQDYKDAIEYSPNIFELFKCIEKELNVQKVKNILKSSGIKKCKVLDRNCKVGQIVKFGSYPFDEQDKVRPIEWRVLAVQGSKALLITKYGIDCKPYNEEDTDIIWEHCSLRRWLNNEFYNIAFSKWEKEVIVEALVKAEKNPQYDTYPGIDTKDKVFLVNIRETNEYFSSDADRKCVPTEYAITNGCDVLGEGLCYWWLRSPGDKNGCAASVDYDGSVFLGGDYVDDDYNAVRPALWVNLSAL